MNTFTEVSVNSIEDLQVCDSFAAETPGSCAIVASTPRPYKDTVREPLGHLQSLMQSDSGFVLNWKKTSVAALHCRLPSFNESKVCKRITLLA